ncbi:Centrosomal protein of 72 kDa [Dispira simplex]|nr:Centrosomal protein of 72 kDa [Dispira simplex]
MPIHQESQRPQRKVQILNLRCRQLNSLHSLQTFPDLRILCITHNRLTHLTGVARCVHLRELYAGYNVITNLNALRELQPLTGLRVLGLKGNPFTEPWINRQSPPIPSYVHWVRRHLSQVERLDGQDIREWVSSAHPQPSKPFPTTIQVNHETLTRVTSHRTVWIDQPLPQADIRVPTPRPLHLQPQAEHNTHTLQPLRPAEENHNILLAMAALSKELDPSGLRIAQGILDHRQKFGKH